MDVMTLAVIGLGAYFLMKKSEPAPAPDWRETYHPADPAIATDAEIIEGWKEAPGIRDVKDGTYYNSSGEVYRGIGPSFWQNVNDGSWYTGDPVTGAVTKMSGLPPWLNQIGMTPPVVTQGISNALPPVDYYEIAAPPPPPPPPPPQPLVVETYTQRDITAQEIAALDALVKKFNSTISQLPANYSSNHYAPIINYRVDGNLVYFQYQGSNLNYGLYTDFVNTLNAAINYMSLFIGFEAPANG